MTRIKYYPLTASDDSDLLIEFIGFLNDQYDFFNALGLKIAGLINLTLVTVV